MTIGKRQIQTQERIFSAETSAPRVRWGIALILAMIAGIALRVYAIERNGFWYDEAYTASISQNSYHDLVSGVAKDAGNPPLYWLAIRYWSSLFGQSENGLRSFSVVCGVATIPVLAMLGNELVGPLVGIMAAALFAISPLSIELSDEARCYALLHLLATLNLLFFFRWIDAERKWDLVGCGLTTFLACYCHYYAFALPAAQIIALSISRKHRRLLAPWLVAMAVAGLMWLPWLAPFLSQLRQPGNLSRMGDRWPMQFIVTPLAFALGRTFAWRDSPHWMLGIGMLLALTAFQGPALYGLWRLRERQFKFNVLAFSLAIPYLVPLAAALAGKPLFQHRAASVMLPVFLVLLAFGLYQCNKPMRVALCGVILTTTGLSLFRYGEFPLKDDWRSAVPVILAANHGEEPLLFDTPIEILSFKYYVRPPAQMPATIIGLTRGPTSSGRLPGELNANGQRIDMTARDYTDQIMSARRVSLVLCVPTGDAGDYVKLFAVHHFNLVQHWAFHRIDVYEFAREAGGLTPNE